MATQTPDIFTEILTRIWYWLNSDSVWANSVPPANQVRWDQVGGTESPDKPNTNDADYPQASLILLNGSTNLQASEDEITFETHSPGGPKHWVEDFTATYQLVVSGQLLGITETDQLLVQTLAAIRKAGPRLGLPYLTSVKIRFGTAETDEDGAQGVRRLVNTIDISVIGEVEGSTLTGA